MQTPLVCCQCGQSPGTWENRQIPEVLGLPGSWCVDSHVNTENVQVAVT